MNLVEIIMTAAIGEDTCKRFGVDTDAFLFIRRKLGEIKVVDLTDDDVDMIVSIRNELDDR